VPVTPLTKSSATTAVSIGGPRNNFTLAPSPRYLFIAGGIGITPLLPMLAQAEMIDADWQLLYGGRTRTSMAFLDELEPYGDKVTVVPQDEHGLLDLAAWLPAARSDTKVYCCGPGPLLDAVERQCAGWPTGLLSLRFDREQNLWAGMMYQGAIAKLDRKSGRLQLWSIPPELNKANTQINMTSPLHFAVDGKMWTQNNGFAAVHRIDLASGKWETFEPFKDSKRNHNIYDVIADSKNNVYFTDFANEHIGRIDAKSGKVTLYPTPTPGSSPRRGMMDAQDRLWFAEYRGNRIGLFDPRTERFQEWEAPTAWSAPYDIALDRNGEAWTGSMLSDRILRLDPKSGRFVEYLLPRPTNIRRVFVDNSATPVAFWVGSNHGASIIKLEPLD